MIMSWIWAGMVLVSILFSILNGQTGSLAASALQGAQAGIELAVSMAGAICLWTGIGKVMSHTGITYILSRGMMPVLRHLFPGTRQDPLLAQDLSANICANILGLGNAATPMGISAARRMKRGDVATDELCRLVVLNTASIQLIPANVAAVRAGLGCNSPFDILGAVWLTSFCSAGVGVAAAWAMGKAAKR